MINVLYVNNEGGGFPQTMPINEGTSFGDFIGSRIDNHENYRIRLNNEPAVHETVLMDGDKIVVTPIKVEGGC